jgi:nucleotide-binding universal stress UspA family protein
MFRRILVPLDGTAASEKAVPYAVELARLAQAQVVVCHVVESLGAVTAATERVSSAQYIEEVADRLRASGVSAKTEVRRGDPSTELLKAAADCRVDAIVMATRSRRRVQKLMLGSVADVLVRDSRLPVLLVSSGRQLKKLKPTVSPSAIDQGVGVLRVMQRLESRSLGGPSPSAAAPQP